MPAYTFDAHNYAPNVSPANNLPVSPPEGWTVQIISVDQKPTKDDDSSWYMEFLLQIVDGPQIGSTGVYRLQLGNRKSEQTVNIAMSQLSSLCYVTGVMMIKQDLMELANISFRVTVVMQAGKEAAEKGWTEIKKVLDVAGKEPNQNAQPTASSATPQFAIEDGKPKESQVAKEATHAAAGFAGPPTQTSWPVQAPTDFTPPVSNESKV